MKPDNVEQKIGFFQIITHDTMFDYNIKTEPCIDQIDSLSMIDLEHFYSLPLDKY